jgi:ribose/xylose/arabinose/galactoside ABC-type transport system permease subunit
VSSYVQQIAIGAVIIVAVLVDMALRRRAPLPRGTSA